MKVPIPTCGRIVHVLYRHIALEHERWPMLVQSCTNDLVCSGTMFDPRGTIWLAIPHRSIADENGQECWEWPEGTREHEVSK